MLASTFGKRYKYICIYREKVATLVADDKSHFSFPSLLNSEGREKRRVRSECLPEADKRLLSSFLNAETYFYIFYVDLPKSMSSQPASTSHLTHVRPVFFTRLEMSGCVLTSHKFLLLYSSHLFSSSYFQKKKMDKLQTKLN